MGKELAAAGPDKCQSKATKIKPATQSSSIIYHPHSAKLISDADGERVISPLAGPSIMSSFWSSVQGTKECTGHAQQVIFPQINLPEGMETGSLHEFRAETTPPHHHSPWFRVLYVSAQRRIQGEQSDR